MERQHESSCTRRLFVRIIVFVLQKLNIEQKRCGLYIWLFWWLDMNSMDERPSMLCRRRLPRTYLTGCYFPCRCHSKLCNHFVNTFFKSLCFYVFLFFVVLLLDTVHFKPQTVIRYLHKVLRGASRRSYTQRNACYRIFKRLWCKVITSSLIRPRFVLLFYIFLSPCQKICLVWHVNPWDGFPPEETILKKQINQMLCESSSRYPALNSATLCQCFQSHLLPWLSALLLSLHFEVTEVMESLLLHQWVFWNSPGLQMAPNDNVTLEDV